MTDQTSLAGPPPISPPYSTPATWEAEARASPSRNDVLCSGVKGTESGRRVLWLKNLAELVWSMSSLREPRVGAHPQWGGEGHSSWHVPGDLRSGFPRNLQVQFSSPVPLPHCSQESLSVSSCPECGDSDATPQGPWVTVFITCVVTRLFVFVEAGVQNLSSLTRDLKHTPPAGEVRSLNHWTDREGPVTSFISSH